MASPSSLRSLREMSDDDLDERGDRGVVLPGGGGGGGGGYDDHSSSSDTEEDEKEEEDGGGYGPDPFYRRVRPRYAPLRLTTMRGFVPLAPMPSHQSESDSKTVSDDGRGPAASSPSSSVARSEPEPGNPVDGDTSRCQPSLPELPRHQQQLAHQQAAAAAAMAAELPLPDVAPKPRRREHLCKYCGKSYPSNQALGGHTTKHTRLLREAAAAGAVVAAPLQDGAGAAPLPSRGKKPHVCSTCGKEYGTGYQLGGHKRAHYSGPPIELKRDNKKKRHLEPPAEDDAAAAAPPAPPPGTPPALPPAIKPEEEPPVVVEEVAGPPAQGLRAPAPPAAITTGEVLIRPAQ